MKCHCGSTRFEPVAWSQDAVVPAADGSYPAAGTKGVRCVECGALHPSKPKATPAASRQAQRAKRVSRRKTTAAKRRKTTTTKRGR